MIEDKDILFLSGVPWEFSWQRHQEIARRFSRRNRVLYVEMGISPVGLWKEKTATLRHWKKWKRGVREIGHNLYLYPGPPMLPLGRSYLPINHINQRLIFNGVERALTELEMTNPLVWIGDPYFSIFCRDRGQRLTIFDWIHDDPEEEQSRKSLVYRSLRAEIIQRSNVIFTPSRLIYERHGRNDPRFSLVPHGVALDSFSLRDEPLPIPVNLESIPPPRIGFLGTVGPTVDRELLNFLAEKLPGYSFVIIGPVQGNVAALKRRPNIYFLGPRDRKELPRYLKHLSAGIIPYVVSRRTKTVHPVKTYEYLAMGLTVVSTDLPELRHLQETIELASSPEDFLRRLQRALKEDSPEKRAQRMKVAQGNSWESRMEVIERIIEEAINEIPN